jgi:hypothetical protein
MNIVKELNLKQTNFNLNRGIIFTILSLLLTFTACNKENNVDGSEEFPSLKVENQLNDSWRSIIEVSLIGYQFDNLNIEPYGDSQTFVLDEGMSGGYENINIIVKYIRYSGILASRSIKVDFNKGKTTTITLTGCDGAVGCPGIYLELNL